MPKYEVVYVQTKYSSLVVEAESLYEAYDLTESRIDELENEDNIIEIDAWEYADTVQVEESNE